MKRAMEVIMNLFNSVRSLIKACSGFKKKKKKNFDLHIFK